MSLLERIRPKCIDEGECWIWTGDTTSDGMRPRIIINGQRVTIRKALWVELHGREPKRGHRIGTKCGTHCCIAPDHLLERSRSTEMLGKRRSVATKAKIAAARRVGSIYTPELIAEIRSSSLTHQALAEAMNLPYKHIRRIRNYDVWRDYVNPFAGLGARA